MYTLHVLFSKMRKWHTYSKTETPKDPISLSDGFEKFGNCSEVSSNSKFSINGITMTATNTAQEQTGIVKITSEVVGIRNK